MRALLDSQRFRSPAWIILPIGTVVAGLALSVASTVVMAERETASRMAERAMLTLV